MNYIGIDGNVHSDELKHWKYIKKIKSGSGWRYFYTPEEVRAYYQTEKNNANAEYVKNLRKENERHAYGERVNNKFRKDAKYMNKHHTIYSSTDVITGETTIAKGKEKQKRIKEANKAVDRQWKKNKRIENFHHKMFKTKYEIVRNAKPVINTGKAMAKRNNLKGIAEMRNDYRKDSLRQTAQNVTYSVQATTKEAKRHADAKNRIKSNVKAYKKKRKEERTRRERSKPTAANRW